MEENGKSALVKLPDQELPEAILRQMFPCETHDTAAESASFLAMIENRRTPFGPPLAAWSAQYFTEEGRQEADVPWAKDLGENSS